MLSNKLLIVHIFSYVYIRNMKNKFIQTTKVYDPLNEFQRDSTSVLLNPSQASQKRLPRRITWEKITISYRQIPINIKNIFGIVLSARQAKFVFKFIRNLNFIRVKPTRLWAQIDTQMIRWLINFTNFLFRKVTTLFNLLMNLHIC